jgi:hypothetical protein
VISRLGRVWTSVVATLALGASVHAQAPPTPGRGTTPFAWIDDASLLPPGELALSISALRWQGADLSQVDAPVFGVAAGLLSRVQLSASIPRVVGNDISALVSGLGTTFASAKISAVDGRTSPIKLALAPTVEILDPRTAQALGENRAQFGLPVSVEIDERTVRIFASGGRFTPGIWFGGGGFSAPVTPHLTLSASFSRAWTGSAFGAAIGDRRDVRPGRRRCDGRRWSPVRAAAERSHEAEMSGHHHDSACRAHASTTRCMLGPHVRTNSNDCLFG